MAERRMFSKTIIDSDAFLDMPLSAQSLYFHLSMRADDEGFINNPKKIQRMIGASDDDAKILVMKHFIIPFDSGIVVIRHWMIHNYIQKDRFKPTIYRDEKKCLDVSPTKEYTLETECIQDVSNTDTQVRLGKDRIGKVSEGKESIGEKKPAKHKHGEYAHVLLTDSEYQKLCDDYTESLTKKAITYLDEYIEMKGVKYKSHNMAMRKWVFDAVKEKEAKNANQRNKSGWKNDADILDGIL